MSRHLEFPRHLSWDHDYWLGRCEGFRVDAPSGRLGLVEAVRFGARLDRPDELLVRGGVLRGDHDWSRISEREANLSLLRGARSIVLPDTGHFAALEQPARVAEILLDNREG